MNAGDRDWMITGVSLRSAEVAEQMNPQQGLYTVTERSAEGTATRLIGALREVLVGTTSAQLDPDLLFYCMSRGISENEARALMIESFIGEAIDKVEHQGLKAALMAYATGWLAASARG